MPTPPFPFETLRYWYVTPFGGRSRELAVDQIGILRAALEANTELDPEVDRVRIGLLGQRNARPVLFDQPFELVPLDTTRPEALSKSPLGEVVLPEGDDVIHRPFPRPRDGDPILINSVAARRFPLDPKRLEEVLEALFRKERGKRPAS